MSMRSIVEAQDWQRIENIVAQAAPDPNDSPMPLWCIALQADISKPVIKRWLRAHGRPYEGCLRCVYRPEEGCTQKLCDLSWRRVMERA
jgi:hypothetical protein